MELTNKQKAIKERREASYKAYITAINNKTAITAIVKELANKFKVTEVQIYNDIKHQKQTA